MTAQPDIEKLDDQIQLLKKAALALSEMGDQFPAVKKNTARVLASIKMMEINVSDVVRLTEPDITPPLQR
ncbi:MAG: hypothetical protein ACLQDI_10075 [Syntrophobacteraceae bacterium]|jgi:hypothetical protein